MSDTRRLALVVGRRIAIVVALVLVLLQPGVGRAKVPTQVADLQVLVVVDRTRSMAAEDYDGQHPRIDGVRRDLEALAADLPGARFGLLTFGFDARLELPFTTDTNAFDAGISTMTLELPTAGIGSSIDRPKQLMIQTLSDAQEQYPDRRTVVVFVSDGENTSPTPPTSMTDVGPYVEGGVVLGYGTTAGGAMPNAANLNNTDGFIVDPSTGRTAISHEDPDALRTLAGQLGVPFEQRDRPGGMDAIASAFRASYVAASSDEQAQAAHDLTCVAGLALLGLVLLELRAGWRALWSGRRALR